jgi:hypothetical protein
MLRKRPFEESVRKLTGTAKASTRLLRSRFADGTNQSQITAPEKLPE